MSRVQFERRCFFFILTLRVQLNFINIGKTFLGGVRRGGGGGAPLDPPSFTPALDQENYCSNLKKKKGKVLLLEKLLE